VGNSVDNVISISQVNGFTGLAATLNSGVTLSGGDGNDKIYGYYNSSDAEKNRDADDYLVGGSGNDYLDGGFGVDTLEGGLGNDTITVDDTYDDGDTTTYDKIWEFNYEGDPVNGGQDWVISKVDIDLKDIYTDVGFTQLEYVENGMFIENLTTSSNDDLKLYGNWLNNSIVGGGGDNSLFGEAGSDTLIGDGGDDWLDGGSDERLTDILIGTSAELKGFREIDTLTGGEVCVLGDKDNVYYNSGVKDEDVDYAFILDYGKLQVKDFATEPQRGYIWSDPTANASVRGTALGTGVYFYRDNADTSDDRGRLGAEDDLIAFLNQTVAFDFKKLNLV
jgi:Ca2+-binding RTX toxin-like protein